MVRGFIPEEGVIDHALKKKLDKMTDRKARKDKPPQEAVSHFKRIATVEVPVAVDRYPNSRYSVVELRPETGRKHQLRRHMKHIIPIALSKSLLRWLSERKYCVEVPRHSYGYGSSLRLVFSFS